MSCHAFSSKDVRTKTAFVSSRWNGVVESFQRLQQTHCASSFRTSSSTGRPACGDVEATSCSYKLLDVQKRSRDTVSAAMPNFHIHCARRNELWQEYFYSVPGFSSCADAARSAEFENCKISGPPWTQFLLARRGMRLVRPHNWQESFCFRGIVRHLPDVLGATALAVLSKMWPDSILTRQTSCRSASIGWIRRAESSHTTSKNRLSPACRVWACWEIVSFGRLPHAPAWMNLKGR
jgi:hypothetical protein